MTPFRRLAPEVQVHGQISDGDIAAAAASGLVRIINNRPDGEDPGQPTSAQVEAAARAAGLDYLHIPIVGLPDDDQVAAVAAALQSDAPTLMFCRSGTRSAVVWALATARSGRMPTDDIRAAAARAGYDLARLPL